MPIRSNLFAYMEVLGRLKTAFIGLLLLIPAMASAAPVTISGAVAPPVEQDGTGLCMASAISSDVTADFGNLNVGNYNGSLNAFIEAHAPPQRVERVIQTLLDLSNNNFGGTQASLGDFRDAVTGCQTGGCDFDVNDAFTSFGVRLRGYFNITADLVNQPIHFGFYVDDAISLTFFDKNSASHSVVIRPPQLGVPTWRLTETVTFEEAGLYPVEILYVELAEHAALEMSYLVGPFADFERPASQPPVVDLAGANFTLFPNTLFYQTLNGNPAFPDVSECVQCDRQFSNLPGNGGCGDGYYCNDAALCAPCDTDLFCGPTCSPCGAAMPHCINQNENLVCVECRDDDDCRPGYSCDLDTNTCQECVNDDDCERGETCQDNMCVACNTPGSCAGNSCNCCPGGMQCAIPSQEPGSPPVCLECLANADCASGVCDVVIGRCMDELANNERPDCCGPYCLDCPPDHPYCLPNPISTACAECRWDTDCPDGMFCNSGECRPCTEDKRCGLKCLSCAGDTPFCLAAQTPVDSFCVRCVEDADCNGGTCNTTTHECETSGCSVSCPAETPYCDGQECVECFADSQCPCGGTCNLSSNTCADSCNSSKDCLGYEHCIDTNDDGTEECEIGAIAVLLEPDCLREVIGLCSTSVGAGDGTFPLGALAILAIIALVLRRRRRTREAR